MITNKVESLPEAIRTKLEDWFQGCEYELVYANCDKQFGQDEATVCVMTERATLYFAQFFMIGDSMQVSIDREVHIDRLTEA